jgi:molybdopterin converting factor subunit 1
MKILYFAGLRQRIGVGEEEIEPPPEIVDVAALIGWLKSRGPDFAEALADTSAIRIAVDQEFAAMDTRLAGAREVALFPPMTGG